jgi:PPOX class probable F420-dependent enzyme
VHLRDHIRLTDEEIAELLDACTTVHVATLNPDGTPHLVPMFFVVREGQVVFWTYRSSQKARNLARDPRLACTVERGERTEVVQCLQLNGTGRVSDDPALVREVGEALHRRYVGPLDDAGRADVVRRGAKRVVVTVDVERTVSWDHTKLGRARALVAAEPQAQGAT